MATLTESIREDLNKLLNEGCGCDGNCGGNCACGDKSCSCNINEAEEVDLDEQEEEIEEEAVTVTEDEEVEEEIEEEEVAEAIDPKEQWKRDLQNLYNHLYESDEDLEESKPDYMDIDDDGDTDEPMKKAAKEKDDE